MRRITATTTISALVLTLVATTALAHPGHLYGTGITHGLSWFDLLVYLAAGAVIPVLAVVSNRRRGGARWSRRD